jgi:hypothetical protein
MPCCYVTPSNPAFKLEMAYPQLQPWQAEYRDTCFEAA